MLRRLSFTICLTASLAGCASFSQSRLNPMNWFGRAAPVTATGEAALAPLVPLARVVTVDGRPAIANLTGLRVDRTPDGAIVTARGVAATQGYFNAELVPVAAPAGVLRFEFRAEAPATAQPVGSAASRTISVALHLGTNQLTGVRAIEVSGADRALRSAR